MTRIRHIVSNTVITWYVTDGDYLYRGEHSIMYTIVESLCCIPEMNITLYVKGTLIKMCRYQSLISRDSDIIEGGSGQGCSSVKTNHFHG